MSKPSARDTPGEGFTPGPWYVHAPEPTLPFYVSNNAEDHHNVEVAVLYGKDSGADARLVAAAPDLLAALERVRDAYGFDPSIESSIWQEVNAAITKARGA